MDGLLSELHQCRLMVLFICVLCIGSPFQFGFHISVVSSPSKFVKAFTNQTVLQRYGSPATDETLTLLWSLTVSIFSIGGLLGSMGSGSLIRRYGKCRCMRWNNVFTLGSSLITGFSRMSGSFEMTLVGRFLCGISTGVGMNVCLLYLGEISPKKLRGLTNTICPIFGIIGKLSGLIFGLREALGSESRWPLLMALSGVTAILQLATFPFFPDTPTDLMMVKKDKEGCLKAMKKLWGDRDHQSEIEDLINEQNARKNTKVLSVLELILDRSLRRQLCILSFLMITLQFCGVNAIYFYAYDVFQQAGFPKDRIPYIAIGTGCCEMLGALTCCFLIEKVGRKALLLTAFVVMGGALVLLTVTLAFQDTYHWLPYCSTVLVFCFILFYGIGPAGVIISLSIEILTQAARPSGFVLSSSLNWSALYITGLIFPFMVKSMGHFCFLLFLGFILASSIFLCLFLPETKGKSVIEITEEFNQISCRRICCRGAVENTPRELIMCTKF
ncbi:solute carrier family 2, facilitated glucose transporter member 11-like [Ambystoma mexicanum]|uniref:solute carrier family 2, facilitated glucose transporter member 11-like n=1 Tax=Ambystoma mexicanum TaxID=8296 RepID=UPI0037E7BCD2